MEVDQCKWNLNGTCSRVLEYLGCDCPVSKKPNLCTKYEPITMIYVNYDRLIEFFDELKISPMCRPENLSLEDFAKISKKLEK